jgi:hypothetical protein
MRTLVTCAEGVLPAVGVPPELAASEGRGATMTSASAITAIVSNLERM